MSTETILSEPMTEALAMVLANEAMGLTSLSPHQGSLDALKRRDLVRYDRERSRYRPTEKAAEVSGCRGLVARMIDRVRRDAAWRADAARRMADQAKAAQEASTAALRALNVSRIRGQVFATREHDGREAGRSVDFVVPGDTPWTDVVDLAWELTFGADRHAWICGDDTLSEEEF